MSVKRTKTDSILECHEKQQLQKELEAVPAQLDTKADAEEVKEKLDTKADTEEVNSKLDTKADSSVVAEQFNKKLDKTEFTGENVADLLEGIGWKGGEGSAAENNHILNGPNHGIKQINANVSGKDASAFGTGTASGNYAHAEGNGTKANGVSSHTEGNGSKANGNYSHAEGYYTTASVHYSHAEGYRTTASGSSAHAEGYHTTALNFQHTCGKYNATVDNTASSSTTNGTAFIIGNGTGDTARSNCFRVQYNGQVFGKGAYSSTGADYAELFEWEDGNPNQEDRRGKFVALQGTKLHIANSSDENIIGVISHKPSLIGNNHSEAWAKMYLTDMWGDEKKETKTIPAVYHQQEKEDGSFENILIEEAYEEEVPIINPAYDPSQTYIPRHERKEWGIVGMLGQLIAEDDGSCEPGGFCRCSEGGVATKSEEGYYVMERLDTHYIRILFR